MGKKKFYGAKMKMVFFHFFFSRAKDIAFIITHSEDTVNTTVYALQYMLF